ncbi:hypothetical protein ADU37_CDS09670 [Thermococcus sp. 2319x1]|nr:hypothetical protein ADU37_CDS09670 [Thermococcus sp. 2319x1]
MKLHCLEGERTQKLKLKIKEIRGRFLRAFIPVMLLETG